MPGFNIAPRRRALLRVHAKDAPRKPSEFDRICEALDGYFAKAFDARKRLLEQPYEAKLLHAWRVNLRRVTATLNDLATRCPMTIWATCLPI